jgi:hypothetical protein
MVSGDVCGSCFPQLIRADTGTRSTRRVQCSRSIPSGYVNESEQVTAHPACLWSDDTLGGDGGNCGVDRVSALLEDLPAGFGGQMMWCRDRVRTQEFSRSGSRRLSASRTERTTALDSSPST